MDNPFMRVRSKALSYDPTIITEEQLEEFLNGITPENGIGTKGSQGHTVNYYRPWLRSAFLLTVMIGDRISGMVQLKWKDHKDNFFGVPNWKVNKLNKSRVYTSWTPVTLDLAEVLLSLEPGGIEDYIIAPDHANRNTLKKFISKAFTHYWRKAEISNEGWITLHSLRKTYVTKVIDLIGDKAGYMKHADLETVRKHYADQREIFKPLQSKRMFNFDLKLD
jgi:integrase